jgi:hypothetical protein
MLNNRVIGLMSLLGVLASLKRYNLLKVSQDKWVYTIYQHGGSPLIFVITIGSWVIEKNQNRRCTRSGLKNQNQKNHLFALIQKPQRIVENFMKEPNDFLSNYLTFSKNK